MRIVIYIVFDKDRDYIRQSYDAVRHSMTFFELDPYQF